MKPLVITLPDSIRERLETALDAAVESDKPMLVNTYEYAVREVLLPLHPDPREHDFLRHFQDSLMQLHTGSASPAIMLRNLPHKRETGKRFVLGLGGLLGDGKTHEQPIDKTGVQPMHKDGQYHPDAANKHLAMLYCEKAGYPVVPTTMATADELVDHWAELIVKRGHAETVDEAKETLIVRLKTMHCHVPRADSTAQELPLLLDNPNYEPDTGAPRYMLSIDPRCIHKYIPNGHGQLLQRELTTAMNSLRNQLSEESIISTEDNTVTFYNDPLVMHARGAAREVPSPEEGGLPPSPRKVWAYDMLGSVALGEDEEYTPQINATGSPIGRVSFTEREGSMVINGRWR